MKALKALIFILFFCNGLSTSTARECQTNAETIVLTSYPIKPKDRTGSTSEPFRIPRFSGAGNGTAQTGKTGCF